jgi:hypothetical protein
MFFALAVCVLFSNARIVILARFIRLCTPKPRFAAAPTKPTSQRYRYSVCRLLLVASDHMFAVPCP